MRQRNSSRLLIIDKDHKILLFRFKQKHKEPACDTFWATPGGEIEHGETAAQAAARELYEETGLSLTPNELGKEICCNDFVFCTFDEEKVSAHESIFVIYLPDNQHISFANWTLLEREIILEHKWWNIGELRNNPSNEIIYPENIVELLQKIIRKSILTLDKASYFDQLFEDLDCKDKTIQNKCFENCGFKHCNFDNAKLFNCRFVDCKFTNCTLNSVDLNGTSFANTNFEKSKLMGIIWPYAKLSQIKLPSPIHFHECNISYSSFMGLYLAEITIQECIVHDVDFREADLSHSNLIQSDFHRSLFIHTKLIEADFSDAINYSIDTALNDIKKATFSFPDVMNLLQLLEINIKGLD